MNPDLELHLKRHVERIVRPVRARWQRKLRMREDLFAHLQSAFEEEARRLPSSEDAMQASIRRMGEPAVLTQELQASVPRSDRFFGVVENCFAIRIGESPWRLAIRVGAVTLMLAAIGLIAAPLIAKFARPERRTFAAGMQVLAMISIWVSVWSAAIVTVMAYVGRAVESGRVDRSGTATWCLLLAAWPFVLPLWGAWMIQSWDVVWFGISSICSVVILTSAIGAGWLLGGELRQRMAWEGLDLTSD